MREKRAMTARNRLKKATGKQVERTEMEVKAEKEEEEEEKEEEED